MDDLRKEKNKMKKNTIDKIGYIVIVVTIVLLNIFIGSNIKDPIWIIQAIVSIFTLIYIIAKKIQKEKNIIIKGKIDIAVLIFMFSTIIPYITRNYVSLEGTINFILKYWSVYGFYILTRNIIIEESKINTIKNTLIISSIIPIIVGYDKLTINILEPILDYINSVKIEDTRMISIFGYANTFAAYLGLTTSLAIEQFIKSDKKKKVLYGIYIIIASITIMLTQSKFVLALLAFIILLFIIKGIKDKKISKKWFIVGIIAIVVFMIYFFIAKEISKPLEITEEEKTCVIRGIESNTKYEFELNLEAQTDKNYDVFEISIVEINRYFAEKTLQRISFANYSGTRTINFETNEQIDHIEIRITNKLKQKLTINGLKINGEPYILEYKIIPEEVVRVFTTFNFKNSSVWQRVDYWRDSIEIIKDRWLVGSGGNTWRTLYGQEQDYLYYAKEAHCYILEVWMSFGLLGIISYIFIIAITIQNGMKEHKKILSILVGVAIIAVHSLMDFDMSYLIIEMVFYMFIAIINKEDKLEISNAKILETTIAIFFGIVAIGNTLGLVEQCVEDETGIVSNKIAPWVARYQYNQIVYLENNQLEKKKKIEYIKQYIKNEPYQNQNTMYEIMVNQIIKNDNQTEDTKYLIDIWKNVEIERPYEIRILQYRGEIMLNLAENLSDKELSKQILEIIINEYPENSKIILDYRKNRETELVCRYKYGYYTDTYQKAIELLNDENN